MTRRTKNKSIAGYIKLCLSILISMVLSMVLPILEEGQSIHSDTRNSSPAFPRVVPSVAMDARQLTNWESNRIYLAIQNETAFNNAVAPEWLPKMIFNALLFKVCVLGYAPMGIAFYA